jgi:hypothetical protein
MRCPGRDSSRAYLECECSALPLRKPAHNPVCLLVLEQDMNWKWLNRCAWYWDRAFGVSVSSANRTQPGCTVVRYSNRAFGYRLNGLHNLCIYGYAALVDLGRFLFFIFLICTQSIGARVSVVDWGTVLQAGRSQVRFAMRSLDSFYLPNPSSRIMVLRSTTPLTQMSTKNLPGGKRRPVRKADKSTAICEPIV